MRKSDLPDEILLGKNRFLRFIVAFEGADVIGGFETHPNATTGEPCTGTVFFDVPENTNQNRARWIVENWIPLTLSPSILCSCGNHGFIRDGKWVPA